MKTVKLTYNFDWPLFRQTPHFSACWGDYQFVIDSGLKECDFWVIYSEYNLKTESCNCNKDNIVFLPAETYDTSAKYPQEFMNQFGRIITVQKQIKGDNVIHWQNANPWFVEKSYDELITLAVPEKTKLLSVVTSNKVFTRGHQLRLDFCLRLKEYFGNQIDLFGRGINDFQNKWDVVAPYKYHLAIENDFTDDWVTEKFFDAMLAYSFPIYYGCPNLERYIPNEAFARIDINKFDEAVGSIEQLIRDEERYGLYMQNAARYRNLYLNEHQLFPVLCHFFDGMNAGLPRTRQVINGLKEANSPNRNLFKRLLAKFR